MEPVRIEKIIPGGQVLGTFADGKKVMLWGALPGEIVTDYYITKNKSSYCEGIALKVIEPSAHRIKAKDACYLATSPWQILDYQYELEQKHALLLEIFRQQKVDLNDLVIDPVQTDGKDFYYRNKMEYALYYDHADKLIHPAFRERGSHRKTLVTQSSLEMPEIWQKANEIIDELNQKHDDARKFQSLLLRCNQNAEVSGGLFENGKKRAVFTKLEDEILGQKYSYSPNGFFQINLPVYEMVLREIKQQIKSEKVLDLYSGVGTIGLSVARDRDLTLVECDKSAYQEMENNCQNTNAKAVLAKSEDALDLVQNSQTVIVDPPRAGCMPNVIKKFNEILPQQIIYLSCNPITQARDIAMLLDNYKLIKCSPYNFFPRTPHLENLVILERK